MEKFIITSQQIQQLFGVLCDFPAKQVLGCLDLLRSLPKVIQEPFKPEELPKNPESEKSKDSKDENK